MVAICAVGRMSALFLFFILYTNNILCSNAQPTLAPTASGPQIYTVIQVIDTTKKCISIASTADKIDVLMHDFITAT